MAEFTPAERVAALPKAFFASMRNDIAAMPEGPVPLIDVSVGNPDLPTPEHLVRVMQEQVADPENHRYPSFTARPRVRAAVAKRYREDHGVTIDPDAHLAAFHGSHEALMAAVLALVDPGDALVLPDPGYPAYLSAATQAGARPVTLPLDPAEPHRPRFDVLDDLATARALVLNYPNNPTGALARPRTFSDALAVAERLGAVLLHDFAYSSLGFGDTRPLSALAVDTGLERTVEVSTLSKTYSMAGWRFGYVVGAESAIAAMRRFQSHAYSTVFGAVQETAAAALSGDQSAAEELVAVYRRRRDLVVAGLRRIGWETVSPEGAFFVWVRVPGGGDDVAFAERLLHDHRVAVAPGSGFGPGGAGFVRIGLVRDERTLTEMIERLAGVRNEGTGR